MHTDIGSFAITGINKEFNGGLAASSIGNRYAKLKSPIEGYATGTKFLIKSNNFHWVAHEYIANKLYKYVMGNELISDTILVSDGEELKIATKFDDNLKTLRNIQENSPTKHNKLLADKHKGFAKAFLTSCLFHDGDIDHSNNFATTIIKGKEKITRYDFDDSFKFIDCARISPGLTVKNLESVMLALGKDISQYSEKQVHDMLQNINAGGCEYPEVSWASLHTLFYKQIKSVAMVKALKEISAKKISRIKEIIEESIDELVKTAGIEKFQEVYNEDILDREFPSGKSESFQKKFTGYIQKTIEERFNEIKGMELCASVEYSLEKNNIKALFQKNLKEIEAAEEDIECESFSYPYHEFFICTEAERYNNDASKLIGQHCAGVSHAEL